MFFTFNITKAVGVTAQKCFITCSDEEIRLHSIQKGTSPWHTVTVHYTETTLADVATIQVPADVTAITEFADATQAADVTAITAFADAILITTALAAAQTDLCGIVLLVILFAPPVLPVPFPAHAAPLFIPTTVLANATGVIPRTFPQKEQEHLLSLVLQALR
ncbi:MAG: hypothetical protein J6K12_03360 [Clostridia bacterium]|nr:hypothetical protein [Clostridia bacterium]